MLRLSLGPKWTAGSTFLLPSSISTSTPFHQAPRPNNLAAARAPSSAPCRSIPIIPTGSQPNHSVPQGQWLDYPGLTSPWFVCQGVVNGAFLRDGALKVGIAQANDQERHPSRKSGRIIISSILASDALDVGFRAGHGP